ncbi:MAG: primosomal protein N', partial [Clostridia bacterium]|nr:primosomal protein N' [Clostridia bacterium]
MKNTVLKIALENISYSADVLYSYCTSDENDLELGQRVVVPFGIGNSKKRGIILGIDKNSESENLKEIFAVIDKKPLIDEETVELIKWMKDRYFCTYFDVVRLVFPSGCGGSLDSLKYRINRGIDRKLLSDIENNFLELIENLNEDTVSLKKISSLKFSNYNGLLSSFIRKGILEEIFEFNKTIGQRELNVFSVSEGPKNLDMLKTEPQKKVYEYLCKNPASNIKEIRYYTGVGASTVNNLVKKGILKSKKVLEYKSPKDFFECDAVDVSKEIILNDEQKAAYNSIIGDKSKQNIVSLLHGVTGSGKTSVLLRLIDKTLQSGKTAIFMVPEIALTSQFISLFKSRYGEAAAVIHSALTDWQRYDIWQNIRSGKAKVVVGTRSAVFSPLSNIGLIVIDEEHEFTYKSEYAPMYDTREVAVYRAKKWGAKVVLSSATPSIESYYAASNGKYNLCELKNRYGDSHLPNVQIIDMNENAERYGEDLFSSALIKSLKDTVKNGNQAILLINRRGFNSFLKCSKCFEVAMCPNCSVSLSYHKANDRLMCHYCGYSVDNTNICPSCGQNGLTYFGTGTQKIESMLSEKIPDAKILRLDSDVKNCKKSLGEMIKNFSLGEYDILIGTQMVAKGFNFPKVNLVGILCADNFLYDSDFRSSERIFSLITQVVGRAGRMNGNGRAIIQTSAPEHEIIRLSASQNYKDFYKNEISVRKLMLCPPFCDICVVNFSGKDEKKVLNAAKEFFAFLKTIASEKHEKMPLRIYSPTEARIKVLSKNYRYKIII